MREGGRSGRQWLVVFFTVSGDDSLGRHHPCSSTDGRLLLHGSENLIKISLFFFLLSLLLPASPSIALLPTPRHNSSGKMKLQLICHLPSQGLNYFTKSSLAPNSHLLLPRLADTSRSTRRLRIGRRARMRRLRL